MICAWRRLILAWLGALTVATAAAAQGVPLDRPAPDIGGATWINSAPLTMEALRGRVVYVEFWTYG